MAGVYTLAEMRSKRAASSAQARAQAVAGRVRARAGEYAPARTRRPRRDAQPRCAGLRWQGLRRVSGAPATGGRRATLQHGWANLRVAGVYTLATGGGSFSTILFSSASRQQSKVTATARPSSKQISIQRIANMQRTTSSSQPAARERQAAARKQHAAETPASATSNKQQAGCSNDPQAGSNSGSYRNNSSSQNNKGWGRGPRPFTSLAR